MKLAVDWMLFLAVCCVLLLAAGLLHLEQALPRGRRRGAAIAGGISR